MSTQQNNGNKDFEEVFHQRAAIICDMVESIAKRLKPFVAGGKTYSLTDTENGLLSRLTAIVLDRTLAGYESEVSPDFLKGDIGEIPVDAQIRKHDIGVAPRKLLID